MAKDPLAMHGEVVPQGKSLQFGQWSIPLTRKTRTLISVFGISALCVPASFFLSEFNQTRGIVDLAYSRIMLGGLWFMGLLMCLLVVRQFWGKWLSVFVSILVPLMLVVGLDLWAPKPESASRTAPPLVVAPTAKAEAGEAIEAPAGELPDETAVKEQAPEETDSQQPARDLDAVPTLDNRPWIFVADATYTPSREIRLVFTNRGRTPAYRVRENRWMEIGTMDTIPPRSREQTIREVFEKRVDSRTSAEDGFGGGFEATRNVGTLEPGGSFVSRWSDDSGIWLPKFNAGKEETAQHVGTVAYTDYEGKKTYLLDFCYEVTSWHIPGAPDKPKWYIRKCSQDDSNDSR